jgi:hypothetical protein
MSGGTKARLDEPIVRGASWVRLGKSRSRLQSTIKTSRIGFEFHRGVSIMTSPRQSYFAYAALLVGVIAFASSFARPTSGQQAATAPAPVGRYQVAAARQSGNDVYVIDTVTGKVWHCNCTVGAEVNWFELPGLPAAK